METAIISKGVPTCLDHGSMILTVSGWTEQISQLKTTFLNGDLHLREHDKQETGSPAL